MCLVALSHFAKHNTRNSNASPHWARCDSGISAQPSGTAQWMLWETQRTLLNCGCHAVNNDHLQTLDDDEKMETCSPHRWVQCT